MLLNLKQINVPVLPIRRCLLYYYSKQYINSLGGGQVLKAIYLESHFLSLRFTALCTAAVVLQYEYIFGIIYRSITKRAAASASTRARASRIHFFLPSVRYTYMSLQRQVLRVTPVVYVYSWCVCSSH